VTVIYLVQHGDKVRGPGDPALTELGLGQAAATARWLAGAGLQALFSSPAAAGTGDSGGQRRRHGAARVA
jgi:broad specificity phosphatase PhoE